MTEAANTLDDFPAETFTIFVFCDACDRSAPLDRSKVPDGMTIPQLIAALRCSSCGSRKVEVCCFSHAASASSTPAPAHRQ